MDDVKTAGAGRILLMLAGVLLLLVWLVSMPLADDRLCSAAPLGFGYAAVLLLGVAAMVAGARPARPTLTALFGLVAEGYFLLRCVSGDMLSEICRELPLLLAAFLFYGAGYMAAGRRGGAVLCVGLAVGVLVNVIYFFLLREPDLPLEVSGRPTMSLAGASRRGMGRTLFTYCNFATIFLMVAGGVLVCRPIWAGWKGWRSLLAGLVGMAGVVISCLCSGQSVLVLTPLMLVFAWILWFIIRLYGSEKLGWGVVLVGFALLVGLGALLGELFLGRSLLMQISSADTHGRTELWAYIYSLLPEVPWNGYGAGATQWQLVPIVHFNASPNYAHNDYLQAWVDYGALGIGLLVAVLFSHLAAGFWSLASEEVGRERRALVAACMLLLLSLAACAAFEFVWHNSALVGLTAFACGVLAAPVPSRREPFFSRRKWVAGHRPALRPVRPMGRSLSSLCCMGCLLLAAASGYYGWRLLPAWKAQWEYNSLCQNGATDAERVVFLERVMEFYPDPELVDHYVSLSPPAGRRGNLAQLEKMLRLSLESNPHRLFTVTMLAETLENAGRHEEAESLLRDKYLPGGQEGTTLGNWPAYYGMNLLRWGHQRMMEGDHASALSMMEYALNICGHAGGFRHWRKSRERNRAEDSFIAARRVDVDMLNAIGMGKNDSWKQPMRPGGPPALYERWGNEPAPQDFVDPYSRRSPLNSLKK